MKHADVAPRVLWVLALTIPMACDPSSPAEDAGTLDASVADAGEVDAGPLDAAPACDDFTGAYRTEMLLDPCLADTPFQYGPFCVAQDGCAVTVFGTHGEVTGTAGADELTFETEFLQCTARRDGDQLTVECEDPSFMTSCSVSANAAPSLAGVCCTSNSQCDGGDRCSPVTLAPPSPVLVTSACVPSGEGTLAGACATSGGIGDCGADLTCTGGGLGDDAVECRPLCRGSDDCGATENCVWYDLTAPTIGFCMPTCSLYGDECPEGATCGGETILAADGSLSDGLACRVTGAVPAGEVCARSTDCGANHTCARPPSGGDLLCRPVCGPDNECESSADRCQLIGTDVAVAGACVPR